MIKGLSKLIRRTHRNRYQIDGPIMVYQMAKVGSLSVFHTLYRMKLGVPMYHGHVLNNLDDMAGKIRAQLKNPEGSLKTVEEGKMLRKLIDGDPAQKWNLITLVRDPVARNLSRFFYGSQEVIPDIKKRVKAGSINVDELLDVFINKYEHLSAIHWFDEQFIPVFDIDVYSKPFPFERGFDIMRKGRFSVLIIKLEDLDGCATQAMEEFLGIPDFKLKIHNTAEDKWYKEIYKEFKSKAVMPLEYLDEMYNSRFAKHFYSPEELDRFRRRWTQRL